MSFNYHIAKRWLLEEHPRYLQWSKAFMFSEIVTMDSILCQKEVFFIDPRDYHAFDYAFKASIEATEYQYFQLIKFLRTEREVDLKNDNNFEFCGYDVQDYFDTNSWITNCAIEYEPKTYSFSKYGLLSSFSEAIKWISDHKHLSQDLEEGYIIYAIWRKLYK